MTQAREQPTMSERMPSSARQNRWIVGLKHQARQAQVWISLIEPLST